MDIVKKIRSDGNTMKGLSSEIETVMAENLREGFPGAWNRATAAERCITGLRSLLDGKKIVFPGNTLRTSLWAFRYGAEGDDLACDIAVLVRLKVLIPPLVKALETAGIPVSVPEQEPFFVDPRVDLLLRIAGSTPGLPEATGLDIPVCPEEIVEKGPLAMAVFLSTTPPFDALFWKSRPFLDLVKTFQGSDGWRGLLNTVRLETELCLVRSRAQKVQVMTMHGAKGLEFEAVFLPGLEEGILPFAGMDMLLGKTVEDGMDLEEERRLFYVGLTRAKSMLFMSHCASRRVFGKILKFGRSSLVRRLPQKMLRKVAVKRHVRVNERQLSLF